ncbi:MAG: caspase family protein [Pseudomonadota bacterium]
MFQDRRIPALFALVSLLSVLWLAAPVHSATTIIGAEKRVALLVGNSRYSRPGLNLTNPENDAVDLADALRSQGFEVVEAVNKPYSDMRQALAEFGESAQGADVAMFFYAGHGVQVNGENYLIGTDFVGTSAADLETTSLKMSEVRSVIEQARPKSGIIILDACRDNPFSTAGMAQPGLSRISGGAGLLIAYATDPGNVAFDGKGDNSVFTNALLEHIGTPGLDVRLMLGRVRQQVVMETFGRQVPWVEEALISDTALLPGDEVPGATASLSDPVAREMLRWREANEAGDAADYAEFLREFPDGLFAEAARQVIAVNSREDASGTFSGESYQLAAADFEPAEAALEAIGLLSDTRGILIIDQSRVIEAFDAYRRRKPEPQSVTATELYEDASRISMVLASATAQRIRTDLVALRSVEKTKQIAVDALRQIERIAETNSDAEPVLTQAQQDVNAIDDSRDIILARLDQSREYYDSLLDRATKFVPDAATVDLLGGGQASRSISGLDQRAVRDASQFLRHVSNARGDRAGSLVWMSDLLPQQG